MSADAAPGLYVLSFATIRRGPVIRKKHRTEAVFVSYKGGNWFCLNGFLARNGRFPLRV